MAWYWWLIIFICVFILLIPFFLSSSAAGCTAGSVGASCDELDDYYLGSYIDDWSS